MKSNCILFIDFVDKIDFKFCKMLFGVVIDISFFLYRLVSLCFFIDLFLLKWRIRDGRVFLLKFRNMFVLLKWDLSFGIVEMVFV